MNKNRKRRKRKRSTPSRNIDRLKGERNINHKKQVLESIELEKELKDIRSGNYAN